MLRNTPVLIATILVTLAAGIGVGLAVPWDQLRDRVGQWVEAAADDEADDAAHDDHAADRVELSESAQTTMGIKTEPLTRSSYQSNYDVPAYVRELPGASELHLDSRFEGVIRRMLVSEGETVQPGQAIYEIELTDQTLATAQAELLDSLQQVQIIDLEIKRLEPGVRSGGLASKKLLEAEYEKQRLQARIQTRTQELLLRGLAQSDVDQIVNDKTLVRSLTISLPGDLIPPHLNAEDTFGEWSEQFIVEKLQTKPGAMAQPGDSICSLSYHAHLAVEGHAYEKDLPEVRELLKTGNPISISVGTNEQEEIVSDQRVAYLANHVDDATNTYPFYVYLENEAMFGGGDSRPASRFVAWKWKPGQRAHIQIPDQVFDDHFVIPDSALAADGLRFFVFRWNGIVIHDHGDEPFEDDHDHERMDEFQAIEVPVLHRDRQFAVIELGDKLKAGDRIVINKAAQLMFALKTGAGGGHGHDHGHAH